MKDRFDKILKMSFLQMLVCAAVVIGCVTIKNVFPDVSDYVRDSFVVLIDKNVDYVDVFNDIGEAVVGEDGVVDVFGKFIDAFTEQSDIFIDEYGNILVISESERLWR